MNIKDIKRIQRIWNAAWDKILFRHKQHISGICSGTMESFLSKFIIQDVHYYNHYNEYEEERLHFTQCEYHTIDGIFRDTTYTLLFKFYADEFDIYSTDVYIIECADNKQIQHDIFDFFDNDEAIFVFLDCLIDLVEEMENELCSEKINWEKEQDKKEKKRTYGKNKITKRHKKFY